MALQLCDSYAAAPLDANILQYSATLVPKLLLYSDRFC